MATKISKFPRLVAMMVKRGVVFVIVTKEDDERSDGQLEANQKDSLTFAL